MGRLRLFALLFAVSAIICLLASCGGGGNATNVVANPVPAMITLTPSANASVELGKILTFIATPERSDGAAITTPIQFISSDNSVVTVASNGQACAGSWDSLSNPQVCTPGRVGVAEVRAEAQGVSSPSTTVYVHQHVDRVVIDPAPSQPALTANCVSKGHTYNFEATAFSMGTDITATVGPVNWSAGTVSMININTQIAGLPINQARITANTPGFTTISASVGSANSIATPLVICPVQSITLTANGGSSLNLTLPSSTSVPATATVTDISGTQITDAPLTWSTSNAASITVAGNNSTATISTVLGGGATIVASCTPPTCNTGFQPSRPVYADSPIRVTVGSTGATPNLTVFVTSDGCGNLSSCLSTVVPITAAGSTSSPSNTTGAAIFLPATPNSLVFPLGISTGSGFLGTDLSQQGTKGIMTLNSSNAITTSRLAPGKVLAVSPDGSTVIISDTADTPNQLFVLKSALNISTPFSISGATAAAFSPDSLKAFVVAGSNLYLFSTQDAMQTFPLSAQANGVSFLPQGGSAAISGGTASSLTLRSTITGAQIGAAISLPSTPALISALPDNQTVLAVDSPGIDLINTTTSVVSSFSFGRGSFTPRQLIVSSDGSKAYVLSDLPVIVAFDLTTHASSAISLAGNAAPLTAALMPDGSSLYVGGSDNQVHVINTALGVDTQQVVFQQDFCRDTIGNPLASSVTISAALQTAGNTTYTYSLTGGPALIPGESVQISNMTDSGNDGMFTIIALGQGTFTVANSSGVTASGQNGTGAVDACPPDIIAIRP